MIFVSYSEKDRELVEPLVIDLGLLGHNVYFEEKKLGGSRSWDEIFTSIEQAEAFVYTLTPVAQASYSRLLEYEHALGIGKPIIPVRLEPIDLWALPPALPPILDYPPANSAAEAEFARAFSAFLPVPLSSIARPDLSFALAQLYEHINLPNKSQAVESAILLNLRELLERRETFVAAETMLNTLAEQLSSDDPLTAEVNSLRAQIARVSGAKPLVSRRRAVGSLLVFSMVAALVLVVTRVSPSAAIGGTPVVQEADVLESATPIMTLVGSAMIKTLVSPTQPTATNTPISPSATMPLSTQTDLSPKFGLQSTPTQPPPTTPIIPTVVHMISPTHTHGNQGSGNGNGNGKGKGSGDGNSQ